MKRVFDILLVLLTFPFWSLLLLLAALVAFAFQGLPIFFSQERAGFKGRPFRLFKLRTMRDGTGSDAERLTGIGRFLRASSLDELPELVNVLRGEMSLVGPRPLPVRYLPRYSPAQSHRHDVLPGLTGWAQVNGRNSLDWDEKFRYDLEYVSDHNLAMDLKIIFLTILQVVVPRHVSHAGEATMSEFCGCQNLSETSRKKGDA